MSMTLFPEYMVHILFRIKRDLPRTLQGKQNDGFQASPL